jgi:hypothetical protein
LKGEFTCRAEDEGSEAGGRVRVEVVLSVRVRAGVGSGSGRCGSGRDVGEDVGEDGKTVGVGFTATGLGDTDDVAFAGFRGGGEGRDGDFGFIGGRWGGRSEEGTLLNCGRGGEVEFVKGAEQGSWKVEVSPGGEGSGDCEGQTA